MAATRPTYCGVLFVAAAWLIVSAVCPSALAAQKRASKKPVPPFASLFPAEEAWTITLPAPPAATAALDGRRAFILCTSAELVALDRETGETIWTTPVSGTVAPAVHGGLVVVATADGVRAFDASTGADHWTAATAEPVTVLAAGADRVFAAGPSTVVAIDPASGRILWSQRPGEAAAATGLTVSGDGLVISFATGRIVALAAVDGATRWQRAVGAAPTAPLVAHGRVYIGSSDNRLYALDAKTGKERWVWRAGGDVLGAAADAKLVYYTSLDTIVRGVNPGSGNQQWKHDVGTRPVLAPIALDGSVLVAGLAPTLSTFTPATGAALGTYAAPGEIYGAPLVTAVLQPRKVGVVVVLRDGRVVGLRSVGWLFNESARQPLAALPGRALQRERLR